jgi:hypothetical protein
VYRQGNIPDNDTLVKGIDNLRTSEVVSNTTDNMSPAGQQVMENVQKTMQTSKIKSFKLLFSKVSVAVKARQVN